MRARAASEGREIRAQPFRHPVRVRVRLFRLPFRDATFQAPRYPFRNSASAFQAPFQGPSLSSQLCRRPLRDSARPAIQAPFEGFSLRDATFQAPFEGRSARSAFQAPFAGLSARSALQAPFEGLRARRTRPLEHRNRKYKSQEMVERLKWPNQFTQSPPKPRETRTNASKIWPSVHSNGTAPARRLSSETGPNVCGSGINDLHNVTINQHWRAVPDP